MYRRYHSTGIWQIDIGFLIIVLSIVFLPRLCMQHWPKLRYLFAKKQQVYAKVLDVRAEAYSHNKYGEETMHVHYAFFKTEHGEQFEMPVPESVYITLLKDSEGILTYKGLWFLNFEVKEKKINAIFKDSKY